MIKRNYHTHMKYCNHAVGEVEDYIVSAIKNKYVEIGMSDHAPIPREAFNDYDWNRMYCYENMDLDTFNQYLKDIEVCQKKYSKDIHILKALESEYIYEYHDFYKNLRDKLDYMILGVHFYKYNGKFVDTYGEITYENIDGYLDTAIRGMESGLFKYLAHPDLFYLDYKDKNGNHVFDEKCVEVSKKIIECAIKNDIYLEVNVNGLRFSKETDSNRNWKYPVYDFWNIAKDYKDLKIIIGVDAHDPELLGSNNIKLVEDFTKELGLKVLDKLEY